MDDYTLVISPTLAIPRSELDFRFSRSGGPGGQNVNKVETKVELLFNVANSSSLNDDQRARIMRALDSHIDMQGIMHVTSDRFRSQYLNREDAVTRFVMLLQHALRPLKTRKPTRIPHSVREHRLQEKKHRGEIKRQRSSRRNVEE
jgi:ribosome-associated protein